MSEGERIGDAEREAAVADLRTHAAAGRISSAEYEERSLKVGQAGTWADLGALFDDLPEPRPRRTGAPPPPPYGPGAQAPSAPPYGTAPPAPPYGTSPSTGTSGPGSYGSYGQYGPPPAPYGSSGRSPSNRGGGPFGGGGAPPALRRLTPFLAIVVVGLAIGTHAWFLFFLFPVFGALFGGGRGRGSGGNGAYGGRRGRRRGRRDYY